VSAGVAGAACLCSVDVLPTHVGGSPIRVAVGHVVAGAACRCRVDVLPTHVGAAQTSTVRSTGQRVVLANICSIVVVVAGGGGGGGISSFGNGRQSRQRKVAIVFFILVCFTISGRSIWPLIHGAARLAVSCPQSRPHSLVQWHETTFRTRTHATGDGCTNEEQSNDDANNGTSITVIAAAAGCVTRNGSGSTKLCVTRISHVFAVHVCSWHTLASRRVATSPCAVLLGIPSITPRGVVGHPASTVAVSPDIPQRNTL